MTQDFGFLSTSAGVGFLALLTMEVAMIFAQMWSDKQIEAAERRAEIAERRAEIAERARMEEAERAERARREESERAERAERARREESERAERRERRLLELIKSLQKDEGEKDENAD